MLEKPHLLVLPPHAYVPGFSPRHPATLLDGLKATVSPRTPPSELHLTPAFVAGRIYYDAGFFWECHEVLDVVWLHTADPSAEREIVLALIQLANARLKVLMRQPRAAFPLCDVVETRLSRCPQDRRILGLQVSDVAVLLSEARLTAQNAL